MIGLGIRIGNKKGGVAPPPSAYKLVFQADPEYGYIAFTTPLSGIGDFDITFKLESFTNGFFVVGRSIANRAISVTSTTVDVRVGATTFNIPITGSNLDETLVKRVGSVVSVYRTSDLGTPVGSLDTGVTNTMTFDYIGKNASTANIDNYKNGELRSININGLVAYNADQGSGNLNDLIGSNTGILSTQGTAVPIYQPV